MQLSADLQFSPDNDMQRPIQNIPPTEDVRTPESTSLFGMFPDEILALIIATLSSYPRELYAPLTCSRVCLHWRKVIMHTPSLWSLIDTSRGRMLTRLWLANPKSSRLDVRLCDESVVRPYRQHGEPGVLSVPAPVYAIACEILTHVHRWRSLEISYSCVCLTLNILSFLCGPRVEPLQLDSLTIGPMGKASLVLDDDTPIHSHMPPIGDSTVGRARFENVCIQPTVLRVDTVPVCPSHYDMFSSRLMAFRYMTGNYLAENPNISEWYTILAAAPNLVELDLWHSRHGDTSSLSCQKPLHLPTLRKLGLTGLFVQLSGLFARSPLPSLKNLLVDSLDTENQLPDQIAAIALLSPALEELSIGSKIYQRFKSSATGWAMALRALSSVQKLIFSEMEWEEVALILAQLDIHTKNPVHVRLERIYDLRDDDLTELEISTGGIRDVVLVDCVEAGTAQNNDLVDDDGFFDPPREPDDVVYRKYLSLLPRLAQLMTLK